jgi:flagellar basal-body rod protein FlgC
MANALEVLANGLSVARMRMNTISSNIANAETTRTAEGGPYRRKDIVQVAVDIVDSFRNALDEGTLKQPKVMGVVEDQAEPRLVYQPGHPDANPEGYVAYPNINIVTSMTDLMSASRLYQANITAVETVRKMQQEATRISIRS